ncbi:TIGR02677 family protein [Peribacillus deserti]|uniref:TIGR02677 family protein n=1 Tax=Peribacillus deserti TaxID=673318 RepID=A0A2N5M5I2_9BACI|nr:TIGR02677 family protein [Peribacillus deserti]PLT29626.1 TIGR02677 family protein [Peribacillus deserti]
MSLYTMKKVIEASYLTAEKAWSYRTILRFFFGEHERMRDFITPEEIYQFVRTIPEFHAYSEEQLHLDLAQLVKWNNLIARQDMGNAKTVEEYKKKRFRYQCTPYTVEIERMLQRLEGLGDSFQGSLERTQFDRVLQALIKLEDMKQNLQLEKAEEAAQMWEDLFSYFRNIRQSTADYIAYVNSEKAEEQMQTEAFLVYKNQFTAYLRDFIVSLQKTSMQIQQRLNDLSEGGMEAFFTKVVQHKMSTPRLEEISLSEDELLNEQEGLWGSLCHWFLGSPNQQSELDLLQIQTNEMIRRITRFVQRIGERNQNFRSRKKDYLHLAKWFYEMEDQQEAHKLSSIVFGTLETRHLFFEGTRTEDIYSDIWDEHPLEMTIKPRINQYREKTKPGAIIANSEEKEALKRKYLQELEEEQEMIEKYIVNQKITISELPIVEPNVRKMLLTWIGKSMTSRENIVKTNYGTIVKVFLHRNRRVILEAEDGKLEMPDAELVFMGG